MLSLDIAEIDEFQGELKSLSKENFEKLRKEILDTGYAFAMHVWQDPKTNRWKLVDGHQRFRTLTHLITKEGYACDLLPVVPVAADDYKQAKRRVLQGTSQYGEMTNDGLYEFMSEAELHFDELDAFRLPDIDIEDFKEEFEDKPVGHSPEDDVPEVKPDDKRVKLGDLFILGEHRLLCGDSTDKATVDRLMGGEKADMVYTDPPYGVNEQTNRKQKGRGKLAQCNDFKPVHGDDKEFDPKSILLSPSNSQIIFGSNYFASKLPEKSSWIIWDKRDGMNPNDNADCELAWYSSGGPARIFRHRWNGMIKASEHGEKRVHPTQKPIALAEWCFENYGNPKTVLDLFGGSGSTLIACEKTKRKCFMMEIDPTYCAVILDRWAKFTSLDPVREDGKKWSEIV